MVDPWVHSASSFAGEACLFHPRASSDGRRVGERSARVRIVSLPTDRWMPDHVLSTARGGGVKCLRDKIRR